MLYNYLKVILRNFVSDGMYTFIIIFGLAIGLSSIFVIGQYIYFELSFDQHVKDKDRIYYTYLNWKSPDMEVDGKCFPAVAPFIETSIPEIESAVRIANVLMDGGSTAMLRREENEKIVFRSQTNNLFFADPGVIKFFSIIMLAGNADNALKEPNTMVITRSLAEKFFPNEDPINKILTTQISTHLKIECRITGVAENPAPNATLQFNALFSMEFIKQVGWDIDKGWQIGEFQTFTKLYPAIDFKTVERKINVLAEPLRPLEDQLKLKLSIHLYPFERFHFFRHNNSSTSGGIQFSGDKKLLSYLGVLTILILVMSLANYINLTTARALQRAKEVGLRKVNGASRKNLVVQFLMEFSFLNLVSFFLALTMAQFLFPIFARAIGSRATWMFWTNPWFWLMTLVTFIFCTAASGIYPAFILSNYKPAIVFKGNFTKSKSGIGVRRGLVLVQFSLSVVMIMSIYVIARQLFFMQNKDLGIAIDQVMAVRTNELDMTLKRDAAYHALKSKLENFDNVISISSSMSFPGSNIPRQMVFHLESDAEKRSRPLMTNKIGENYFKTMGLELLYGRDFIVGSNGDSTYVVINETGARELGFSDAQTAVGEYLISPDEGKKYEIIGVIKDFSLNLKEPATGEVFFKQDLRNETSEDFFLIKLSTNNLSQTMARVEKEWKLLFPQAPLDYFFLDTYFDTFYKEEKQFAGVFAFFSVIGILITCMGLFGLSLFDTNNRIKEIGIRKSLGASVRSIMWLFSKDYMKLVLIAGIIAVPVGIYLLDAWLENYPQRIDLTADAVLFPLILMCCIAIFTVGYHTYKTACVDPVKSLRAE